MRCLSCVGCNAMWSSAGHSHSTAHLVPVVLCASEQNAVRRPKTFGCRIGETGSQAGEEVPAVTHTERRAGFCRCAKRHIESSCSTLQRPGKPSGLSHGGVQSTKNQHQ